MYSLKRNEIILIGSGGHSRMIIECARELKYKVKFILDINSKKNSKEKILGIPIKSINHIIISITHKIINLIKYLSINESKINLILSLKSLTFIVLP